MKKPLVTILLLIIATAGFSQKIKIIKKPVSWSYEITPESPLSSGLKSNQVIVKTEMGPMDLGDRVAWGMQVTTKDTDKRAKMFAQAEQDTIRKWSSQYLALTRYPLVETTSNPDFTITLETDQFEAKNVQLDVDYSDQESILFELNVTARLTVKTADGKLLLDQRIRYTLEDEEEGETTYVRLRDFMLNPGFKTKYKLAKKPERKKKLLENKIDNYEADILEFFFMEGRQVLRNQFIKTNTNAYSGFFGIKDKSSEAFNEATTNAASAVLSINALSKKKRQTLEQIKPVLEASVEVWEQKMGDTNPEVVKLVNANLATAYIFLGDFDSANAAFQKIPEAEGIDNAGLLSGSFKYYIKGLSDALKVMANKPERTSIAIP